jgi:hypothetical protein
MAEEGMECVDSHKDEMLACINSSVPEVFQVSSLHCKKMYSFYCKKRLAIFSSPAGMSPSKLFLAGNNLIISGQGEFGK